MLLSALWGGSFLAFAIALIEVPVASVVAHRVGWAALALWIIALFTKMPRPQSRRVWGACLVMGVLNNVIPFLLIAWAQTQIASGLAAILNATTAFFGLAIAALIFTDERLTKRKASGTLIGFGGLIVVVGLDALRGLDPQSTAQLAMLGAALSYAFASAWGRARLTDVPPQAAALGMLTASAAVMLPTAYLIDGAPRLALAPQTWGALGYLALGATSLAYLLYYRVLGMAGAANLMLVTLLVVPIAVVLGVLVLDERLARADYIGFALIALGMVVIDGRAIRLFNPARDR